jgi:hypothetical protein
MFGFWCSCEPSRADKEAMEVDFSSNVEANSKIEAQTDITDTLQQEDRRAETKSSTEDCAETASLVSGSDRLSEGSTDFMSVASSASTGLRERRGLRELSCETEDLKPLKVQTKVPAAQVLKCRLAEAEKSRSKSKSSIGPIRAQRV